MAGAELVPLALAGRLALALALAVFLGLAFEEVYKREERSAPGGVRTFPMLALSGAMLYLIEPRQALAFIVGLMALAIWLRAFLHNEPASTTTTSLMIPTTESGRVPDWASCSHAAALAGRWRLGDRRTSPWNSRRIASSYPGGSSG